MTRISFALPVAAGKEEGWRRVLQELEGSRFGDAERAGWRLGIYAVWVWLQRTRGGELAEVHVEAEDPARAADDDGSGGGHVPEMAPGRYQYPSCRNSSPTSDPPSLPLYRPTILRSPRCCPSCEILVQVFERSTVVRSLVSRPRGYGCRRRSGFWRPRLTAPFLPLSRRAEPVPDVRSARTG